MAIAGNHKRSPYTEELFEHTEPIQAGEFRHACDTLYVQPKTSNVSPHRRRSTNLSDHLSTSIINQFVTIEVLEDGELSVIQPNRATVPSSAQNFGTLCHRIEVRLRAKMRIYVLQIHFARTMGKHPVTLAKVVIDSADVRFTK